MGITMENNKHSIDMGYAGFNRLRNMVADFTAPDIAEHYKALEGLMFNIEYAVNAEKLAKAIARYDERTQELDKKYGFKYHKVLVFLYASDANAQMTWKICKAVYDIAKQFDDNIRVGYVGRPDCATVGDFKKMLKYCISRKRDLRWF